MDQVRSEQSRRTREELIAVATPPSELLGPPADAEPTDGDDSLALLFGCCHPDLSSPSQIALTLRAVGGLSTAQIAAAFGVPEATMAQRISRAKQTISGTGFDFSLPAGAERTERLRAVLHVLYLVFNEGYTATEGDALTVPALSQEAIRLTRWLHRLLPDDGEVAGLLALMLLTDARRPARTQPDGSLIPLAEQDRQMWDQAQIAEGIALISAALPRGEVGPYQLQAAIAAVHDEAKTMADTDWPQILGLYDLLELTEPRDPTRSPRSTGPWRWPWCTGRMPGWRSSRRWRRTSGWRGTTGCSPPGRTCANWPATPTWRPPTTSTRPGARPACPSAATWRSRPRGLPGGWPVTAQRDRPGPYDFTERTWACALCGPGG